MKKVFCIVVALVGLFAFSAQAESFNLSALSFQELVQLQQKLNREIMSRPEWKEVTVPVGTWKVGVDIPAGTYSVTGGKLMATLEIYSSPEKNYRNMVESYTFSGMTTTAVGRVTLSDGQYVVIDIEPLTFAPPISLGF